MEVRLPVTLEHCIESAVRDTYGASLSACLGEDEGACPEICDLLARFAAAADFPALRRLSEPYLLDGKKVCFVIRAQDGGAAYRLEITD